MLSTNLVGNGTGNIICSASSSTAWNTMATSYTGVTQSNTMDASATSSIASAALNFSTNLTTIANNCWSICYTINDTNIFASNSDTRRGTNIGGGGGGGGANTGTSNGGAGGSGVVIISYATNGSDGVSTSSTGGTITTSGGQTIHTFTSNGTFTMVASNTGSGFLLLV